MTQTQPFPDDYLAYLLARTSELVSEGFHARLKEQGISVTIWRLLSSLSERPRTVGELAALALLQPSTTSKALDRLETQGLISRSPDPDSRRVVVVTLTEAGREMTDRLLPLAEAHEQEVLSGFSEDAQTDFKNTLRGLIAALSK